MTETEIYHAVHDHDGNIRSIFVTRSSVGAGEMMTPEQGCSVSQVSPRALKIPKSLKLISEDDAKQIRNLLKQYRVDTSIVGSVVKRVSKSE
jgi:hypothetical protein